MPNTAPASPNCPVQWPVSKSPYPSPCSSPLFRRFLNHILQFYFTFLQENVHPLQGGYFWRKLRRERRAGLLRETPLVFYPRRVREVITTHAKLVAFYIYLHRIRRRVERDPRPYTDAALAPIDSDVLLSHRQRERTVGAAA